MHDGPTETTRTPATWRRGIAALILTTVGLAGCADAQGGGGTAEPTMPDAPDGANGDITSADGTDPLRVLLAVVILTAGDVDAAVAEGIVTPDELDAASAALAAGEVGDLLARAQLALDAG